MKRILSIAAVAVVAVSLAACQSAGPKQTIGGLGGAAAGGLIGSQIGGGHPASIAAGVLIGGLLGSAAGNALDNADRAYAAQTASRSLETAPIGRTSQWRNPNSGHSGTFTPTRTYRRSSGQYCREYNTTVYVGGREQQGYGTACRQRDGSWQLQR